MNTNNVPETLTIDGTTYTIGADAKTYAIRGTKPMTRRRRLVGPNGGSCELIEFEGGAWRLLDSRGVTRSKGPRPGVVDRPRSRVSDENRVSRADLEHWLAGAQEIATRRHNEQFPTLDHPVLSISPRGRRYAKIIEGDDPRGRRVWAFIDLSNGDVLKPHGFDAPAEGARGNLFDRWSGLRFIDWTGPFYLDAVNAILYKEENGLPAAQVIGDAGQTTLPAPTAESADAARLVRRPKLEEGKSYFAVFQMQGGANDGQQISLPADEGGEPLAEGDRRTVERGLADNTLRLLGVRSEQRRRLHPGIYACPCGEQVRYSVPNGVVRCPACKREQALAEIGGSEFQTCAYCQGALPADADRHWHATCAEAARTKGATGGKSVPKHWTWVNPKKPAA